MSEAKFTPGPWAVSTYTNYTGWSVFGGSGGVIGGCLAERWYAYTLSEAQNAEAHANARLIAAAPTMYAALEAVQALFDGTELYIARHGGITNGDQDRIDATFFQVAAALRTAGEGK